MQSCCCAKVKPAASTFRRYRRSTLTRAPRKRTFIANMQKFLIDYQLPSGLAGESFFGASTLCQVPTCPVQGAEQGQVAALGSAAQTASGNGNGRGRGRPGAALSGDGDEGGDADQLSILPVIVAVAFCAALYPALDSLAPSAAAAAALEPQPMPAVAVAVQQQQEAMTFDAIQGAIDAFLLMDDASGSAAAHAPEPKLAAHMG